MSAIYSDSIGDGRPVLLNQSDRIYHAWKAVNTTVLQD